MADTMFYGRPALEVLSHLPRVTIPRRELVATAMRNGVPMEFAGILADLSIAGLEPLVGGKWMSCANDGRAAA